MRQPMVKISDDINDQNRFNELQKKRLGRDAGLKRGTHRPMPEHHQQNHDHKRPGVDQKPVEQKMHDVGSPAVTKEPLLAPEREKSLERGENGEKQKEDEKLFVNLLHPNASNGFCGASENAA